MPKKPDNAAAVFYLVVGSICMMLFILFDPKILPVPAYICMVLGLVFYVMGINETLT